MAAPKVRQFAGDFRLWTITAAGMLIPVIPEPLDPQRNQPVETNALTFSYEAGEETTINSKRRGARFNQPIYSEQLPGTTSVSATLLETPTPILARILYGEAANQDIASGSVTDEPIQVERLGAPFQLPHRYLTATAPEVKFSGTPLEAGTDYLIDRRTGTLSILASTATAGIVIGSELLVSYSYEAVTSTRILGGATPTQSYYITGDMEDRVSGEQGYLQVYEAKLGVDGEVDWLSSEPIQPVLTGVALVPDGAPAPYTFDVYSKTE